MGNMSMPDCDCPHECVVRWNRCREGDAKSCDDLLRAMMPSIGAVARGRMFGFGHSDEWEEVRQDVALRIYRKWEQWNQSRPFCHWVAAIASKSAISARRAKRWQPWPERFYPQGVDVMAAAMTRECIETKLAGFPEEWVRIYDLTVQGVSRKSAAATLGISLRALHYRLDLIRKELLPCR